MRRARVAVLVAWTFGSLAVTASASAQTAPAAQPKAQTGARSSAQFTLRREEAGGPAALAARNRARAGDCAGALPSFDVAIEKTYEPTLKRDRGLCHDKLGNVFPAIDDFRAYLVAAPNAPDADQIRTRLATLEQQSGGPSSMSKDEDGEPIEGEAAASISVGKSGVKASASSSKPVRESEEAGISYDQRVAREKSADDAEVSPLRDGTGVVLGPFVHIPRFFFGEGASSKLAYGVGVAIRYSTGRHLSVISELGYAGIGTSGENTSASGPLLFGGLEFRLPVTPFSGDHVLLRAGIGYERYVVSGTRFVSDTVLGRAGLGFRHVFGPSVALEFLGDGGPAYFIPEAGDSALRFVLGGSAAFLVGF